jgi:hypothetical protein
MRQAARLRSMAQHELVAVAALPGLGDGAYLIAVPFHDSQGQLRLVSFLLPAGSGAGNAPVAGGETPVTIANAAAALDIPPRDAAAAAGEASPAPVEPALPFPTAAAVAAAAAAASAAVDNSQGAGGGDEDTAMAEQ